MGEPLQQLSEAVQSFLSVNGQLPTNFYKQFWASFRNSPDNVAFYLTILFSKLIAQTTGEDKHAPLGDIVRKIASGEANNITAADVAKLPVDQDGVNANLRQCLWLTIYFIGINLASNDSSQAFRSAFAKWLEFHAAQKGPSQLKDFADEAIRVITPKYIESYDMINVAVECASTIDVPQDISQELVEARALSRSFLAQWLTTMMPHEKFSVNIIEAVLLLLRHPLLPEGRVLCLLQLLSKLILYAPNVPTKTLALGHSLVKSYYLGPMPYGDFARGILEVMTLEARSPGAPLRNTIIQEIPSLVKQYASGKERQVYVIADVTMPDARLIHEMLKNHPAEEVNAHQLQVDLLASIFGDSEVLSVPAQHLGVEFCSAETVNLLFQESLAVMDQATKLSDKEAHAFRTTRFSEIRERILTSMQFNQQAAKPRTPAPLPRVFSINSLIRDNSKPKKGDDFVDPNLKFPARHSSIGALAGFLNAYKSIKTKLKAAAANSAVVNTGKLPIIVKIGVIGNDVTIHHVVGAYVCLRRDQPALFTDLVLRFYMIPVGPLVQNQFASFLSRYDRWYYRHQWLGSKAYCSVLPCMDTPLDSPAGTKEEKDVKRIGHTSVVLTGNPVTNHHSPTRSRSSYYDLDKQLSLASLVDSIKEAQKQKQLSNNYLKPVPNDEPTHDKEDESSDPSKSDNNEEHTNGTHHKPSNNSNNSSPSGNRFTQLLKPTSDNHKPSKPALNGSGPANKFKFNVETGPQIRNVVKSPAQPSKPTPLQRLVLPISPARHLRNEIEAYFREAKQPLNVKVFQCECFSLYGEEVHNYTIPFVAKVELGINSSIRAFQEANDLPVTLSTADIMANKLFKYFPINVSTKYVPVNPLGAARPAQTTDLRTYTTITMTNVGNTADRVHPNPVRPWLEMCVVESETKKKKQREEALNVSTVEIETEDKKKLIDVIIDGELYGPVYRVRISACTTSAESDSEQLSFPIMTYFPIDLP